MKILSYNKYRYHIYMALLTHNSGVVVFIPWYFLYWYYHSYVSTYNRRCRPLVVDPPPLQTEFRGVSVLYFLSTPPPSQWIPQPLRTTFKSWTGTKHFLCSIRWRYVPHTLWKSLSHNKYFYHIDMEFLMHNFGVVVHTTWYVLF